MEPKANIGQQLVSPSILGISSGYHGAKLPINMLSKEREELLKNLNAWRQERAQKLAERVLAKGKPLNKPKVSSLPKTKTNGTSSSHCKSGAKDNVFDRLYCRNSKSLVKELEGNKTNNLANNGKSTQCSNRMKSDINVNVEVQDIPRDDSDKMQSEIGNPLKCKSNEPEESSSVQINDNCKPENEILMDKPIDKSQKMKANKNEAKATKKVMKSGPVKEKPTIRRSISMCFRTKSGSIEDAIHRTQSCNDVNAMLKQELKENFSPARNDFELPNSIKANDEKTKNVCFLTPKNKPISASQLRKSLEEWLTTNGHSIDGYRHLQSFGFSTEKTPATPYCRILRKDESSNLSFYSTAPNTPLAEIIDDSDKENVTPPTHTPKSNVKDVEGLLTDLHSIIVNLNYPKQRCEEWLTEISRRYPECNKLPVFWECLAALGEERNDLGSSKTTPIVKNKSPEADNSLSNLLNKMTIDDRSPTITRVSADIDPKNIIRSRAVKFTLRKKPIKLTDSAEGKTMRQEVLVATPVRRSTRLRTPDTSNIVTSLEKLDPRTRELLSFESNEALLNG